MAEAALFIGWGDMVDGREKRALELFNKSLDYLRNRQEEGRIDRFDVAVLPRNDRDLRGFILVRGTAEQIDSLSDDAEFQQLFNDVQVVVDGVGFIEAFVDEALVRTMHQYQDVGRIGELD
jgi:hypothetical protein